VDASLWNARFASISFVGGARMSFTQTITSMIPWIALSEYSFSMESLALLA
jgi:hypothetical protein